MPKTSRKKIKKVPPQKPLAVKKRTVLEVAYGDLERFIRNEYDRQDYNFVADMECGNDSSHDFQVDGKVDDPERLEAFRNKEVESYLTNDLLNDLAKRGLIEKGTYLVQVCW